MIIDEKVNLIKNSTIFKSLSDLHIRQIAEVAKVIRNKIGDIIFEENSLADALYLIKQGEVEIIKKGSVSPEILAIKRDGDVFGEMAIIDDLPRSATIRAKTNVVLLKLSKNIFNELIKSFPDIAIEIARNICSTVRSTNTSYIGDLENRNKQLKVAYKKLKKTQSELIRLEKLSIVGKFASFIIHDIKNPMTNIRAYAELIKMNMPDNEKIQKSTNVIIQEVDRLNKMTLELLEFSRGEIIIEKIPANIISFITTMIDIVKENLEKKDIEIIFEEKKDCIVMIDMDKMKRVFLNLINNADAALLKGGKISIKVTEEDDWIKWSIQDNGIGMEPDVLEKIFEPFFSKNKSSGIGLGMTIVKNIIEGHSGYIRVHSKKDTGSRFDIFLPKA